MFAILQAAVEKAAAGAPAAAHGGGHKIHSEADLVLPDFHAVKFLGMSGWTLLATGLVVCVLGLLFGLSIYSRLKNMPVHKSMREISELIYETCKTYLQTQGKFIAILWVIIAAIIVVYFGVLEKNPDPARRRHQGAAIVLFSLIGILGSYGVAWFGIRVNTFANSRRLRLAARQAVPDLRGPAAGRHVDRHLLIATELVLMLAIMLFVPATTPARASSASRSASRSAPRRCASPAASSPRSPTSART
jgi:K(+)-stimulated pyrophosphate-energized sodium pump